MPAEDETIGLTRQPGPAPNLTRVVGADGRSNLIPTETANSEEISSLLSAPDFTARDVAGDAEPSPGEVAAAALGFEEGQFQGASQALAAADEAMAREYDRVVQSGMSAPLAWVGDQTLTPPTLTPGVAVIPEPEPEEETLIHRSNLTVDEIEEELQNLRNSGGEDSLPATGGSQVDFFTDESGTTRVRGTSFPDPNARTRRGRSPVSASTTLTRNFDVVNVDPELEANARRLEDQVRTTLSKVRLREASFQGELAGLEASVADDLLQDREEIAAMATQAAMRQRESLEQLERLNQSVMNRAINPERFFSERGGSARFSAAASVALGTLSQALSPGMQNTALAIIDNAIQRDIEAQVTNLRNANLGLDRQRGLLQDLRNVFGDELQARQALRSMYLTEAQRRIQALAAQADSEKGVLAGQALVQDLAAERARTDADLAARAGTVNINDTIRVRGSANSRRSQREIARMSVMSPAQRTAINYRRVLQGLPPLEAPTPAAPTPRPPRPPRDPRDPRPPQETPPQATGGQEGTPVVTEVQIVDPTIRRDGSGVEAVEYQLVRAPRIDGDRYVVRNTRTNELRTVARGSTIPRGFEQVFENRAQQVPRVDAEEMRSRVAASTPLSIIPGRSVPAMTTSNPEHRRLARAWATLMETDPEGTRGNIEAVRDAIANRGNLRRLLNAYDRHGTTSLDDSVEIEISRLFNNLSNYAAGGDALGIIGPNEITMFGVADPQSRYTAAEKMAAIAALNRRITSVLRQQPAYYLSVPNQSIGVTPPPSARQQTGRR